jgi:hypothetical protein
VHVSAASWTALAQVHATLANAAAIGTSATEARAWAEAAGTKLGRP